MVVLYSEINEHKAISYNYEVQGESAPWTILLSGGMVMNILLVPPLEPPRAAELDNTLEAMQQAVGGPIQSVYPFGGRSTISLQEPFSCVLPVRQRAP